MNSKTTITSQSVATLTWRLQDTLGETLDELDEPTPFLIDSDDLLPAISQALLGQSPGAELQLQLEPEQAFGDYDAELVFLEPRKLFPEALEEGMVFEGLPDGCQSQAPKDLFYTVTDIYPEHVVLDGNHPLAGMTLKLAVKVWEVREATPEELEAASAGLEGHVLQLLKP